IQADLQPQPVVRGRVHPAGLEPHGQRYQIEHAARRVTGIEWPSALEDYCVGRITSSGARRSDFGRSGPAPKRITISGRRSPSPSEAANCGLSVATSTGWLMKEYLSPSAVACRANRWQAR